MKIKVSENLLELAKLVDEKTASKLFIVGGYVRNSLLGFTETDIDLASKLTPEKITEILYGSKFEIIDKSAKVGLVKIKCGEEVYEHTTFRKDNYYNSGAHNVESVDYVEDVRQDAMRRDFTINALYYDILNKKIIDIYSGVLDLKNNVIRCVEVPGYVLAHDGVRILRMIRIASELNFKIDFATFATAKKYAHLLNDISWTRKFNELMAILNAPKRYSITRKNANIKGLTYMNELHIWNSFGVMASRVRLKMIKKVDLGDALFGLLIDIIDTITPDCIEYFLKDLFGADGFNQPTTFINYINNVICGYYDALNKMSNKTYFFKYFTHFDKIGELLLLKNKKLYSKYKFFYSYIIKHKLPTTLKELKISGSDLSLECPELNPKKYTTVLYSLLGKVFDAEVANEKDALIKEVKNDIANSRY